MKRYISRNDEKYYTANLVYKYIVKNDIEVKTIAVDNGLEFKTLGIAA